QLNADQISEKAALYFRDKVGCALAVASFKSADAPPLETGQALIALRQADFVLVGPGSPTYAVRQWSESPVPEILGRRIEEGAVLVAASAAALTSGRFTLPVYEIYKVGEALRWSPGIDLLGRFGLRLAAVPHWNNAEGGNHDTRFCFMGEPRFSVLESMLPPDTGVLGIDEHTACIIDLGRGEVRIRGVGRVTLRRQGAEAVFGPGDVVPLAALSGDAPGGTRPVPPAPLPEAPAEPGSAQDSFWAEVRDLESGFQDGQGAGDGGRMAAAILELDRLVWKAARDPDTEAAVSHARELLREWVVTLGAALSSGPSEHSLRPIMEELLRWRGDLRREERWREADALRDCLQRAQVIVEDSADGTCWHLA
ncbi:MAG TPA: hypothetical protein VLH81_08735, partial [Desulfobacterales bacterium]|nr:hypothetical protein [Desulfobacterales bacterium]